MTQNHDSKSLPNASGLLSRNAIGQKKVLYLDATGILDIAGNQPSGIPRVQQFLVEQAIKDTDDQIGLILFDRWTSKFRSLSENEISLLLFSDKNSAVRLARAEPRSIRLMLTIIRRIRENPQLGKEFDRAMAVKLTNNRHSGFYYFVSKTIVRAYRYYWKTLHFWGKSSRNEEPDLKDSLVLLSHTTISGSLFPKATAATTNRAFICHDVIPWLYPELVFSQTNAQRIVSQLGLLLQSGVHALCTSGTSRAMLEQFIHEVGETFVRIDRFPLPSILYEKAKSLDRLARIEPEIPFIIYCSTIEVRKNHLLLAKIWKQAHDEGVELPKLVCVGKWGWGVETLQAYLDAHPYIAEQIDFVGAIDDYELIDLYRSALFGVMPSFVEGWGMGATECLDFGVPVIVSTAPGLTEAVRGLMPAIDPNDHVAWYAQIRRLAEDETERGALHTKITDRYRPISCRESWVAIKTALLQPNSQARQ